MSNFNWVDNIFIGIFIFSLITGFLRGLFKELLTVLTLAIALGAAVAFSNTLAASMLASPMVLKLIHQMSSSMGTNVSNTILYFSIGTSFATLFIGVMVVGLLITDLLNAMLIPAKMSIMNHLLGGFFGLVRAFFLSVIIIFLFQFTPVHVMPIWYQSKMIKLFQPFTKELADSISPSLTSVKKFINGKVEGTKEKINELDHKMKTSL